MSAYKFYWKQWNQFPDHYHTIYYSEKTAKKIIRKLIRHFKLPMPSLKFTWRRGGGHIYSDMFHYTITFAKPTSLGIICHEIGHLLAEKMTNQWYHNKRTARQMKKVYTYAKRYLRSRDIWDKVEGNDVY